MAKGLDRESHWETVIKWGHDSEYHDSQLIGSPHDQKWAP
jgi:hypothetical protein